MVPRFHLGHNHSFGLPVAARGLVPTAGTDPGHEAQVNGDRPPYDPHSRPGMAWAVTV